MILAWQQVTGGVPEATLKIGTWNLAGRWTPRHEEFLAPAGCQVWLLTEVNERVELAGFARHLSAGSMAPRRRWAGIYSRAPLRELPDPHAGSAAAWLDGTTYCSSVLPWRSCPSSSTWPGGNHSEKTKNTVDRLVGALPKTGLVWGGDWNHALSGYEGAGSTAGRAFVLNAVDALRLQVPTGSLPHRLAGHLSIDHIAVPRDREVLAAVRVEADGLSDHDCYVIDVPAGGAAA